MLSLIRLVIVLSLSSLYIVSCGGSDGAGPIGTEPQVTLRSMQLSPNTLNSTVNDGTFDLSWAISFQSDLNAYYVWFYIIPTNDVSSSSFDNGVYTGEGVQISSWGYSNTDSSVTHQFRYVASTNSIRYSDNISTINRPIGNISGNAYALLCFQTMNSLGQYDYTYDTCEINLESDISDKWTSSIIDENAIASSSIAVDNDGNLHVCYYDYNVLKYATNISGTWLIYEIDTDSKGNWCNASIALDSSTNVHISYYDYVDYNLKYATNSSGDWQTETLDTEGNVGQYSSITVSPDDNVHISYFDFTNYDLKYATNASGSWETTVLDDSGIPITNSIASDSLGSIHIAYSGNHSLKYITNSSGVWGFSTIDTIGPTKGAIAIDSNDKVHISYYDTGNEQIKYSSNVDSSWVNEIVATVGSKDSWHGEYGTSIDIDSNNYIHIAYYHIENGDLMYSKKETSWETTIVESVDNIGTYPDIIIDEEDSVYISYYNETSHALKCAINISDK